MSKQMSLKEAESKVFELSQFQDGWWDILLGGELVYLSFYEVLRERSGAVGQLHGVSRRLRCFGHDLSGGQQAFCFSTYWQCEIWHSSKPPKA